MLRTIRLLRWPLLLAYAVAGALALMLATPNGGAILGVGYILTLGVGMVLVRAE